MDIQHRFPGAAPCDACSMAKVCRQMFLACEAYQAYCFGKSRKVWMGAPRKPTEKIFAEVFQINVREKKGGKIAA